MTRAIVTCGVSTVRNFRPYLDRFETTIRSAGEYHGAMTLWRDAWPPESPTHHDVHYAFKVWAVEDALACGATTVLWLDCSCWARRPVEPILKEIEEEGHYLIAGADKLGVWSSDHALATLGVTREEAMGIPLLSGTIVGLDFTNPRSQEFFSQWKRYATKENFNGTHRSHLKANEPIPPSEGKRVSADPRVEGHRCDEPFTTMTARHLGMKTHRVGEDYFIGGVDDLSRERGIIWSGYDLCVSE